MAEVFTEGFGVYGGSTTRMRDGVWAETSSGALVPDPAGSGEFVLRQTRRLTTATTRVVLPSTYSTLFVSLRYFTESLSTVDRSDGVIQLRDASNNVILTLDIGSTGQGILRRGTSTIIGQTSGPIVTAGTWENLEAKVVIAGGSSSFELRVNEETKLDLSGIDLGSVNCAQYAVDPVTPVSAPGQFYIRDLFIRDDTGTTNNDFVGNTLVVTRFVDSDETLNWTVRARKNIGTGILDVTTPGAAVKVDTPPSGSVGGDDYTVESFIRFDSLPTGTDIAHIFGWWREDNDNRVLQFFKAGPDIESGNLVFRVSSDGTAGTVQNIHSWPWDPDLHVWYHVAISRTAGVSRLFIDGQQQGTAKADAVVYNSPSGSSRPFYGAQQGAGSSSVKANTGFQGYMDEFRFTSGVGRYTANFTPTTVPFGRDVGSDPSFNSVLILLGFDNGSIADESSNSRNTTALSGAFAFDPDDGDFGFQSLNQSSPRDDTFIEASLVSATGVLTAGSNPLDTETVTLGPTTYTFNTVLGGANSVLIGADEDASLNNLVAAVNAEAGSGVIYGSGTVQNPDAAAEKLVDPQIKATARAPGVAGNSVVSTETLSDGSWGNATLSGGSDIPGFSEFGLETLPPEVTGIRSITVVNRGFRTAAGSSSVTVSLVGSGGAVSDGASRPMTETPTYRRDTFEADPDTGGALTPATLDGAKIRINRTL